MAKKEDKKVCPLCLKSFKDAEGMKSREGYCYHCYHWPSSRQLLIKDDRLKDIKAAWEKVFCLCLQQHDEEMKAFKKLLTKINATHI